MFFFDLLQSLFRSAVQLEFHNVDVLVCLQYEVDASFVCVIFHFCVESHQFEDDEKHILIVQFQFTFFIVGVTGNRFIRGVGKETLQTAEETVVVSLLYFFHELSYFECRPACAYIRVEREKEPDEPFLYFTVRKTKAVSSETCIVALYGQITALINYWDGIGIRTVYSVQYIDRCLFVSDMGKVVVVLLQQGDEISGRTRSKPVAAELFPLECMEQAERVLRSTEKQRRLHPFRDIDGSDQIQQSQCIQ